MCRDSNDFILQLHPDLICCICYGILCVDFSMDENQHAFCKSCILRWLKNGENRRCPIGNELILVDQLRSGPRIIRNLLSDYQVRCKFNLEGCKVILKYQDIQVHELQCEKNPRYDPKKILFKHSDVAIKGDKIDEIKIVKFDSQSLYRMVLFNNATQLLITDEIKSVLHVFDTNGAHLESVNPECLLKQPLGLYVLIKKDFEEEIYVGDCQTHQVIIFNSDFSYKSQFGDERIQVPQFMQIDCEGNTTQMYISDIKNNEITVWNTEKSQFVGKIEIDSPLEMKFDSEHLFVTSGISFQLNETSKVVEKIEKGCNSIFVLNKNYPFEVKREINRTDWLSLSTLHITTNNFLYTIAYELSKEGAKSEFKSFYQIDQNGKIFKKILLEGVQYLCDVIFLNNTILICSTNEIKIIKFC